MKKFSFPGSDEKELAARTSFTGCSFSGKPSKPPVLNDCEFVECAFEGFSLRNASLREARIVSLSIAKVDFRGADMTGMRNLHKATGLSTARFDDTTIVDGVDIEAIAREYPEVARKLRQIRYLGKVRRQNPYVYWPWKVLCDCGRSWPRLLAWGVPVVLVFALIFSAGQVYADSKWLPHLTPPEGQTSSFIDHMVFSALAFVTFNLPGWTWSDQPTGLWVACETWLGFLFLGVFVSTLAGRMLANQ